MSNEYLQGTKDYMSDEEIIEGIIRRDENAFRLLVDTYSQMVVKSCFGLVYSKEDAEDIAQEVFIEVYRSAHRFRGQSKLSTWLYRIAINKSLNFIRDNRKSRWFPLYKEESESVKHKMDNLPADNEDTPDADLEKRERALMLHQAINSLPDKQRVAFSLSKYDDLSQKDIAEILGLSVSSVESLLYRAKKKLQKKLFHWYKKKLI